MSDYDFKKYRPLFLRIWHWLNALVIVGLLLTVVLRKTLLSWRTNSALIETKLGESGISISAELAKEIAVAIRNPLWDWHIALGSLLGLLLVGRFFWALTVEKGWPGVRSLRTLFQLRHLDKTTQGKALHFSVVQIGYGLFYLMTFFMVVSGLVLLYRTELGLAKSWALDLKETHEFFTRFFAVFLLVHLFGVVFAEIKESPGLVSDMIHGGKKDPKTTPREDESL